MSQGEQRELPCPSLCKADLIPGNTIWTDKVLMVECLGTQVLNQGACVHLLLQEQQAGLGQGRTTGTARQL